MSSPPDPDNSNRGQDEIKDIADDDVLEKFGVDLTARAAEGKLDPVIGRDDEIRRAIQILSRRTKNNPVLIGDPGVGAYLLSSVYYLSYLYLIISIVCMHAYVCVNDWIVKLYCLNRNSHTHLSLFSPIFTNTRTHTHHITY